jgi:hypothetical protein
MKLNKLVSGAIASFLIFTLFMTAISGSALATRTEIATIDASSDNYTEIAGATSLATGGHYINYTNDGHQIFLVDTNAAGQTADTVITIPEGPFWRGGLGNVSFTLAVNSTYILGPFESARFKQANGEMYVNSSVSHGSILAIELP